MKENTIETNQQKKERQMRELAKKVTQHCTNFSCEDGFNKEEADKDYDAVNWMLQTKSYREHNLEFLKLMAAALDLIVYPDFYKENK